VSLPRIYICMIHTLAPVDIRTQDRFIGYVQIFDGTVSHKSLVKFSNIFRCYGITGSTCIRCHNRSGDPRYMHATYTTKHTCNLSCAVSKEGGNGVTPLSQWLSLAHSWPRLHV
jgi:hypothetical protein